MNGHEHPETILSDCPALETRRLSFRYDRGVGLTAGDTSPWVVRHMDLRIREGEILGVIGPNGSGKSSLLKVLAGLVHPQEGDVRLFGTLLAGIPRVSLARRVAFMPQDVSFDFPFTVADTVLMGRYPYRRGSGWNLVEWERGDDFARADEAMAMTDVTALADRMVGTLSAGERQRVLLARALAQQPRILLLDEPTAHLDLNHQGDVCRILTRVHDHLGMTVVLISHDINLASQHCDRILIMRAGEARYLGHPDEVIHRRSLMDVYGCEVLVDAHPHSGRPRVTMPCEARVT
jgi:iron complex transport system ATP-binding protein